MNQLVYIASPLSGDVERNLDFARQSCRYAIAQGVIPFAPHLLYPQILDDNDPAERGLGIRLGCRMLERCQALWLCGDRISAGMEGERQLAERLGIPVRRIGAQEILTGILTWEEGMTMG